MFGKLRIAVVIPCYRVTSHVLGVINAIPSEVDAIYCIDDGCPDGSGDVIRMACRDPRVIVISLEENRGVGGAVKEGYLAARAAGYDVAVKVDGDGQMDPSLIPNFLHPIATGLADYTKGNRFFSIEDVRAMPRHRIVGNAVLSFLAKFSTGYWHLFDPTNGYTAIHLRVLDLISLDKVADRYFFETDLLFRMNIARCVVREIPMVARYADEKSNLRISRIIIPFIGGHVRNVIKRLFYSYYLRGFNIASLQILVGLPMFLGGVIFAGHHWWLSVTNDTPATAGTVMVGALLIIAGLQLSLAALSYDIGDVPRDAIHPVMLENPAGKRTSVAEESIFE